MQSTALCSDFRTDGAGFSCRNGKGRKLKTASGSFLKKTAKCPTAASDWLAALGPVPATSL